MNDSGVQRATLSATYYIFIVLLLAFSVLFQQIAVTLHGVCVYSVMLFKDSWRFTASAKENK